MSASIQTLESLPEIPSGDTVLSATPPNVGRKRGPVARRRFQKGCFVTEPDGRMYSMFYVDSDGQSKRVKRFIGKVSEMSERAARREHARIMEDVNRVRGSVAPAVRGRTFQDAVEAWRRDIAPTLSPATIRQMESHLRSHILPKFGKDAPQVLDVAAMQSFATELLSKLSQKTVVNMLGTIFSILRYAERCRMATAQVSFKDLRLGSVTHNIERPFFTQEQANQIIAAAEEPYKTMFTLAWLTGLRAGELLALKTSDVDFVTRTIRVNKSADDNTRELRQPKTKNSVATLPMPSALEKALRNYMERHWRPNNAGYLFPNRKGTHPRWRDNVVKYGLKPVLRKLGIPEQDAGLHAFRHGLATELAQRSIPLPDLQKQMRHADIRTTLRVYAHAIPESQRTAMEALSLSIGTGVPIGTETESQVAAD